MEAHMTPQQDYYKTLPREYFFSPEWYKRDIDSVLGKSWLMAGFASQIGRPGDFFTFELDDTSIIVVRGRNGEVNAFHNVCRHRGTKFCNERSGHVKRGFMCQFHGWTYDLDGTLRAAPQMPADFDKSQWPARPARVEVWNGMVFVNLSDDNPKSVADTLKAIDVKIYGLERTKVAADIELTWPCNWKLVSEAFQECYHCSINHPELCQVLNPDTNFDGLKDAMGNDEEDFLIFTSDRSYAIREGMKTFSMNGKYVVKRLLGDASNPPNSIAQVDWFPNFQVFLQPDFAHVETFLPISPTSTVFRASFLVHEDAVEGVDYDKDELTKLYIRTLEQDSALVEAAQRGVSSPAHVPGPFHPVLEAAAINYFKHYERMVRAA